MVDLRRLAEELNIHEIAVCHAGRFDDVEAILLKDEQLGITPPFVLTDIEKRVEPKETLKDAASFIVVLEHYQVNTYPRRSGRYGNISPAACGEDYHRILRRKLNALVEHLKENDPEAEFLYYVDDSPFSEKHVAMRSGLGKILKNGLFYSRQAGSRCNIGIILTNKQPENFIVSNPVFDDSVFAPCLKCKACISLCPGQALNEFGLNSYRCVSYLTQKKETLTIEEEMAMGHQIYGCDMCQKVCPINGSVSLEMETGLEISLDDILSMSNKGFKLQFQQTAAGWRGKKQMQKNAEIILRNMERLDGNMEL